MTMLYLFVSFFAFIGSYVATWHHDLTSMGIFFVTSCVAWKLADKRSRASYS